MFEHFYDLCFVVVLAELVDYLTENNVDGALVVFAVLFIPAWLTWTATTYFTNRFGTDDWLERVLIGLQLLAVAGMALSVHGGLDLSASLFAYAYAGSRLMIGALYAKAVWQFPEFRSFAATHLAGNVLIAIAWGASADLARGARFAFWVAGLSIDLVLPLVTRNLPRRPLLRMASIPERFRVFSVIVLSEAVKNVIDGLSGHELTPLAALSASLAFVVACSLWWIYFDNIDSVHLRKTDWAWRIWANAHLPLLAAFAASSGGVERLVEADQRAPLAPTVRWLVGGSVAVCLLAIAVIRFVTSREGTRHHASVLRSAAAFAALGIGMFGSPLSPPWVIGALAFVCAAQVALDFWLDAAGSRSGEFHALAPPVAKPAGPAAALDADGAAATCVSQSPRASRPRQRPDRGRTAWS